MGIKENCTAVYCAICYSFPVKTPRLAAVDETWVTQLWAMARRREHRPRFYATKEHQEASVKSRRDLTGSPPGITTQPTTGRPPVLVLVTQPRTTTFTTTTHIVQLEGPSRMCRTWACQPLRPGRWGSSDREKRMVASIVEPIGLLILVSGQVWWTRVRVIKV